MTFVKNLTNLFISGSFHRLLQISGSNNVVLDGTGSLKNLTVNGNLTVTGTTTASSSVSDITYIKRVSLLSGGM